MQFNKDHLIPWVVSGCIGVIIRDIYSLLLYLFGLSKLTIWMIAADLFIDKQEFHTLLGTIIGIVADLCIGGILGVLVGIGIDWQEKKNYIFIGFGISLFAWLFFYGVLLHNLPQTIHNAPHSAVATVFALAGHVIWGLTSACVYIWLLNYMKKHNKSWH